MTKQKKMISVYCSQRNHRLDYRMHRKFSMFVVDKDKILIDQVEMELDL